MISSEIPIRLCKYLILISQALSRMARNGLADDSKIALIS